MNPLKLFTTAAPIGVALRDFILALGSVLAVLGVLGVLTQEQIDAIKAILPQLAEQAPAAVAAIGTCMAALVSIYRVITKSHSDKAAEVAKAVDRVVPPSAPVEVKTPPGVPDIRVPGT